MARSLTLALLPLVLLAMGAMPAAGGGWTLATPCDDGMGGPDGSGLTLVSTASTGFFGGHRASRLVCKSPPPGPEALFVLQWGVENANWALNRPLHTPPYLAPAPARPPPPPRSDLGRLGRQAQRMGHKNH